MLLPFNQLRWVVGGELAGALYRHGVALRKVARGVTQTTASFSASAATVARALAAAETGAAILATSSSAATAESAVLPCPRVTRPTTTATTTLAVAAARVASTAARAATRRAGVFTAPTTAGTGVNVLVHLMMCAQVRSCLPGCACEIARHELLKCLHVAADFAGANGLLGECNRLAAGAVATVVIATTGAGQRLVIGARHQLPTFTEPELFGVSGCVGNR